MATKLYHDIPNNRFYANGVEVTASIYKSLLITGEEFHGNTGFGTELAKGYTSAVLNETKNTALPLTSSDTKAKIIQWAIDRGLDKVDPSKQAVKLMEEVGELAGGLARDNMDVIKDSLGDIYVVMVILALRLGIDLQEAIDSAYDVIKDRKGKLINGVFIKQEDLKE
jgi:NTP pyrophosphatase (non-canonical NTP hydrolase)